MEATQAAVLGVVQGITEFLPISSSAHLVIVPYVLGWPDQGLFFDVAANTGTLLALLIYFRHDFREVVAGFRECLGQPTRLWTPRGRLAWWLVLATIPAGIVGLLFHHAIAHHLRHPYVPATTAILFGVLLGFADWRQSGNKGLADLDWRTALWIGLAQAMALIPGVSRSGITLTAGFFLGLSREAASRFAFLLAVPVGILAGLFDLYKYLTLPHETGTWVGLVVVLAASAVSGYVVIDWLLAWIRRRSLTPFVVYRILLGVFIFALVR